jgi:ribosome biogenesis GTPase
MHTGLVLYGINRIYTVEIDGKPVRCRIKGKTLRSDEREYNPLAPGDAVEVASATESGGEGLILSRLPRRNAVWRWNRKRRARQTIAANLDRLFCVCSTANPPFRPRFVDRLLVVARHERIPAVVVKNKIDLDADVPAEERLDYYASMGVPVLRVSAADGRGVDQLSRLAHGETTALVGQSGVGKSSLLNVLAPALNLPTGKVSAKYDRGTHVTNYGRALLIDGSRFIDTPGIREIHLYGLTPIDVARTFDDFHVPSQACEYVQCTHIHEPNCGVKAAVSRGTVHPDRYESYRRIVLDLELAERMDGSIGL